MVSWPAAAHLLKSWVRIPPGAWIFVCFECRVLSGRGLCDELITRPEESYRLWCVVVCDLETSRIGAPYIYIYDISNLRVKIVPNLNDYRNSLSLGSDAIFIVSIYQAVTSNVVTLALKIRRHSNKGCQPTHRQRRALRMPKTRSLQ